jgi:hypothetical protein
MKRDVVRGRARGGCKSGVRHAEAPLWVDKNPIKASQNRRVFLIGPGKLAVNKRDFKKAKIIDKIVEGSSLRGVKISI